MNLNKSQPIIPIMAIAASLAAIVLSIILLINQVTPFGHQNLLVGDMGAQYAPFFTYFHHAVAAGQFPAFSFSIGVGANSFPLVAYYLLSPFNLIILLFSASQTPTAITYILILKVAAIAASMAFFLSRHFGRSDWSILIFAITFSLCGFVAANFVNIMWLDALIYLPLICHGIDRFKAGNSSNQLFIWLTLCILVNYYMGYMIGLFTIIYMIQTIIQTQPSNTKLIAANGPFIRRFIVTELCSGLTSMVVLLPTAYGMLQTAKVGPENISPISRLFFQFGPEGFSQIGLGATVYDNRLLRAPAIFSSLAIFLLVATYFAHPKISRRHKFGVATSLAVLLLSMLIEPINLAWHLFSQPAGSPFRYSFLFSFIMITTAYEAWSAKPQLIGRRAKLLIPTLTIALLAASFIYIRLSPVASLTDYLSLQPDSAKVLLLNSFLVCIFAILITVKNQNWVWPLIAGIIVAEMGTNFEAALKSEPLGNQSVYEALVRKQTANLNQISSSTTLYRINQSSSQLAPAFQEPYLGYNDPLLFNYNGIQEYSSTLNEATRQTLKMLGLYSKNQRRISTAGSTAISNLLLGVKTTISGQTTTPNPAYVGMGFPVTTQFTNLKLARGYLFLNLENTLQRIQPAKQPYLISETANLVSRTASSQSQKTYTVKITPKASGPLYLDTSDNTFDYAAIQVNGYRLKTISNPFHHAYLVKLGSVKKGAPVILKFKSRSAHATSMIHLKSLNVAQLTNLTASLRAHSFQPTYQNNQVTGTVTRSGNHSWLYTAIPYDNGWKATVNGQTVAVKRVLGNFIALPLNAATNHITLTYHTPGLLLGAILSFIGLLAYLGTMICRRLLLATKAAKH
ncbi:membrane protein [Lentilactobacillus fungorum]|uniref:Membrane protein n=1 Tax=Lentilactobacillus fungorum TaxID=2201250 RepID=A0ABQ3VZZ0_9LACO|nr:YfhO family protein [Lentilactobacillus fungorum]GHP13802.1 membrane protein [Lentilactobacillus fungorum]